MKRLFAISLLLTLLCACTSSSAVKDDTGELVGKPPSQQEDPFAVRIRPAQAVPVASTGTIEATPTPPPAMVRPTLPKGEAEGGLSKENNPNRDAERSFAEDPRAHCFSCVRICPADHSVKACEEAQGDVICGWGAAVRPEEAQRVAQAQCDHTLGMARETPQWGEISGACPPATCR